jgi:four helix bundle protein
LSRDHKKLRVFHDAHALTLAIYKHTRNFPKDEWFGIRAQLRRAAVSVPSNLVEGNARSTTRDYLKFLYIALGSACELNYLVGLSEELGYSGRPSNDIQQRCTAVVKQLERLTQTMEAEAAAEKEKQTRPQTVDRRP